MYATLARPHLNEPPSGEAVSKLLKLLSQQHNSVMRRSVNIGVAAKWFWLVAGLRSYSDDVKRSRHSGAGAVRRGGTTGRKPVKPAKPVVKPADIS